jgi:hypothetical protein
MVSLLEMAFNPPAMSRTASNIPGRGLRLPAVPGTIAFSLNTFDKHFPGKLKAKGNQLPQRRGVA